ncbi:MAG: HD-GYP domain-containing protein [Candidatus Saccharibacteria bacterium]
MEQVNIDELLPGMILGYTVVDKEGKPLFVKNTMLTLQNIASLSKTGIKNVFIKKSFADITLPETLANRVQSAATRNIETIFREVHAKGAINIDLLKRSVALLLEHAMKNTDVLISLAGIEIYGDYLIKHSLDVAILSLSIGLSLGLSEANLIDLAIGAVLHDIGMTYVDPSIVNKPDKLSNQEMAQVQKHTEIGYAILRTYNELTIGISNIALQHHERWDGTGYPKGLERTKIQDYARIIAIADVFDALISDRPYRKGFSIEEALIIMEKLEGNYFESEAFGAFLSGIVLYPTGSMVCLNNGQTATVIRPGDRFSNRPVVATVLDEQGKPVDSPEVINLEDVQSISIVKKLSETESKMTLKLSEKIEELRKNFPTP